MFGYVKPVVAELRVREHAEYKSVYCSLCNALKSFGFGAKMLLQYDFVFCVLLFMAVTDTQPEYFNGRCNTNPAKKQQLIAPNEPLRYAAASLILSFHYKYTDDIQDEPWPRKIASFFARFATGGAFRRAKKTYPDLNAFVADRMRDQHGVEARKTASVDEACDATAKGLGYIFSGMSTDLRTAKTLGRLGYCIGRFAYLADAADDLASDLKKRRYNVFAVQHNLQKNDPLDPVIAEARRHLRQAAAEAELCYRLLDIHCFAPILENVIYLGLVAAAEQIGQKKKGKSDE